MAPPRPYIRMPTGLELHFAPHFNSSIIINLCWHGYKKVSRFVKQSPCAVDPKQELLDE